MDGLKFDKTWQILAVRPEAAESGGVRCQRCFKMSAITPTSAKHPGKALSIVIPSMLGPDADLQRVQHFMKHQWPTRFV
jgi:hypothetical protein